MSNKYIQEEIVEISKPEWFAGYYSPLDVCKSNTPYIFSYGGRNIGKTYAWVMLMYATWQLKDKKSVYMRRMADSIKASKARDKFEKIFQSGVIPNVKKYDGILYRAGTWCGYWDESGKKKLDEPFCYTYALASSIEMNKGVLDIDNLGIIFFDEALTADSYLADEWQRFQNAISTIVRENSTACCVLCANTVSWIAPYFREFGIKNPRAIKQGSIKVYKCMDETAVTLEYCKDDYDSRPKKIVDRRFFSFKNSGTSVMIRTGSWELKSYPHLPRDMLDDREKEIISRDVYVKMEQDILCLEIWRIDDFGLIINVRPCVDCEKGEIIYTTDDMTDPRYRRRPDAKNRLDRVIWGLYKREKFFYADNLCGEILKKYLQEVGMLK